MDLVGKTTHGYLIPERSETILIGDFTAFRAQRYLKDWQWQPNNLGWIFTRVLDDKRWDLMVSPVRKEIHLLAFNPQRQGLRLTGLRQVQFDPEAQVITFYNSKGDYFIISEMGQRLGLHIIKQQKFPKEIKVK